MLVLIDYVSSGGPNPDIIFVRFRFFHDEHFHRRHAGHKGLKAELITVGCDLKILERDNIPLGAAAIFFRSHCMSKS